MAKSKGKSPLDFMHFIPNILSLARLMGAPFILWALSQSHYVFALIVFCFSASTDWLDGWLARRYSWQSRLGSLIDPVADKLCVFLTSLALIQLGQLPLWLFWIILARDFIITSAGGLAVWRHWQISLSPLWLGKLSTTLQLALLFECLLRLCFPEASTYFVFHTSFLYTVGVTTVLSGLAYAWQFWHQFPDRLRKGKDDRRSTFLA